jgi:hypothetical protein
MTLRRGQKERHNVGVDIKGWGRSGSDAYVPEISWEQVFRSPHQKIAEMVPSHYLIQV